MRALEFITGDVFYNPAYTYKFQLKTTTICNSTSFSYYEPILNKNVLFYTHE